MFYCFSQARWVRPFPFPHPGNPAPAYQAGRIKAEQKACEVYNRRIRRRPKIMLGMDKAEFGLNNPDAAIAFLDKLRTVNPHFKSPQGHLLYARTL
jgi:hypothetical protein